MRKLPVLLLALLRQLLLQLLEHLGRGLVAAGRFGKVGSLGNDVGLGHSLCGRLLGCDEGEWFKIGNRRILFSCTARLKAGIRLDAIPLDRIVVDEEGRSVSMVLPHAVVLSINIPPELIRLEYEDVTGFRSHFDDRERQALLKQGEREIVRDLPKLGILTEAEANAEEFFRSMLTQMGFENIQINFE